MSRSVRFRAHSAARPGPEAIPVAKAAGGIAREFVETVVRPAFPGARLQDVAAFFRALATLVGAGIPLYQALDSLGRSARNPALAATASRAAEQILRGGRLSEALAEKPYLFGALTIELIRFAEEVGRLDSTLALIADYAEREVELRRLVGRLTLYPKLLAVVAVLICGRSLFGGGPMALVSLALGSGGLAYLLDTVVPLAAFLAATFAVVAAVRFLLFRSPAAREVYETIKVSLPGLGGCVRRYAFARFGRALGAVYAAGVPLYSGLRIAGAACGSALIQRAVDRMIAEVDRGAGLAEAAVATGAFPPVVLQMLATGEQTGDLDGMMAKVADYLESEAETRAHQNGMILSVSLYLLVALLIASFIVAAWGGSAVRIAAASG